MGQGVIIVNIILCNDVCFTHFTIIHNLLTYLLICTATMSYYIECDTLAHWTYMLHSEGQFSYNDICAVYE
jgi:hypothetical protein